MNFNHRLHDETARAESALNCVRARFVFQRLLASLLVISLVGGFTSHSYGQGFFVAQPQPVEYRGTIEGLNAQTRILSIETETGLVFGLMNPTRRTSDGQLVGGIPPVRVRVSVYESPRELRQGMFIQFRAVINAEDNVVEPGE